MRFSFELTGTQPLLMHADDVEQSDDLMAWRKDPKNKSVSVAGDDRSPSWSWMVYLHQHNGVVAMPQECIMAALRFAGAKISGKGKSTFKALSQSGLYIDGDFCKFTQGGKEISIPSLYKFKDEPFAGHKRGVADLGFDLMVKRARVGTSKHVRVRPIFDDWAVSGELETLDAAVTADVLDQMFDIAGRLAGLGDWRPSSPTKPGPYGMFSAKLKKLD